MNYNNPSTHLQGLFIDADHHLCFSALHAEADTQDALVLLRLCILPGTVVEEGGQGEVGQALRHGWRERKGQTGAP